MTHYFMIINTICFHSSIYSMSNYYSSLICQSPEPCFYLLLIRPILFHFTVSYSILSHPIPFHSIECLICMVQYTWQINHGGTVCESLHNDSRGPSQSSFTPKPSIQPAASFIPDSPSPTEIDYLQVETFGSSLHLSKKQKFTAWEGMKAQAHIHTHTHTHTHSERTGETCT